MFPEEGASMDMKHLAGQDAGEACVKASWMKEDRSYQFTLMNLTYIAQCGRNEACPHALKASILPE